MSNITGQDFDITHFEYTKKNNREKGQALVGIEMRKKEELKNLLLQMDRNRILYDYINPESELFKFIVWKNITFYNIWKNILSQHVTDKRVLFS